MVDFAQKENLQPSLLDRLTDDEPDKQLEAREQRILSFRSLRKCVIRDLGWLLNASGLENTQDLSGFPEVRHSVLNYGIPDLTGTTASTADRATLERALREAIVDFEPRIIPESLKIRVSITEEHMNPNTLTYEIEGELWSQPIPERLFFKTILDLELGNIEIQDLTG